MKYLVVFLVFLTGCQEPTPDWEKKSETKITPIVSLFMNKPNDYTAFTQTGNELVPHSLVAPDRNEHFGSVKIYTDVPINSPMYAVKREFKNNKTECHERYRTKSEIEIHVHSAAEINGGQWEEHSGGKNPRTTTGRVRKVE